MSKNNKHIGIMLTLGILMLFSGCTQVSPSEVESQANVDTDSDSDTTYADGQYLIGTDLPAGEYKLMCSDGEDGYYCVSTDSLMNDIIANLNFENSAYVTVQDNQYLYLSHCYTKDSLYRESTTQSVPEPEDSTPQDNTQNESTDIPAGAVDEPMDREGSSDTNTTASRLEQAAAEREQRTFMLCIGQDDMENYFWNGKSSYPDVWREAYMDSGYNGSLLMQLVKDDLDCYLTWGSSSYDIVWISAEMIYEQYKSGELKQNMSADEYQSLIDRLNSVNSRLGILYSSKNAVP